MSPRACWSMTPCKPRCPASTRPAMWPKRRTCSGRHLVAAIQPNAADQARVAALNMAGQTPRMKGVLAINVLDSMGMISSSFGEWQGVAGGDGVERRTRPMAATSACNSMASAGRRDGNRPDRACRCAAWPDPGQDPLGRMEAAPAGNADALCRGLHCLPAAEQLADARYGQALCHALRLPAGGQQKQPLGSRGGGKCYGQRCFKPIFIAAQTDASGAFERHLYSCGGTGCGGPQRW
jgi:hypothetical protein